MPMLRRAEFIIVNMADMPLFSWPIRKPVAPPLSPNDITAGGRAVDAELVFEADAAQVVARAECAVGFDHEFRHEEQRDAARAERRFGQARQDEMDDVLRRVVFAPGDEDLRAGDFVAAVGLLDGFRFQRADVGAGMRFGQVHRAGPFAGDELGQIRLLLFRRAVRGQRFDRALA